MGPTERPGVRVRVRGTIKRRRHWKEGNNKNNTLHNIILYYIIDVYIPTNPHILREIID